MRQVLEFLHKGLKTATRGGGIEVKRLVIRGLRDDEARETQTVHLAVEANDAGLSQVDRLLTAAQRRGLIKFVRVAEKTRRLHAFSIDLVDRLSINPARELVKRLTPDFKAIGITLGAQTDSEAAREDAGTAEPVSPEAAARGAPLLAQAKGRMAALLVERQEDEATAAKLAQGADSVAQLEERLKGQMPSYRLRRIIDFVEYLRQKQK